MSAQAVHRAFIGLGSNLGDPVQQVRSALAALDALPSTRVVQHSRLYRTKPVGYAAQPDFINAVAELSTALEPRALLHEMLALEGRQGRVRNLRNGPRTLDLDLLLFDARELDEPDLVLPHPRLHERAFAVLPLHEIAPDAIVPGHGEVSRLVAQVDTDGIVLWGEA